MAGFRPLAGMNCFSCKTHRTVDTVSFRPLAGMNCFQGERANIVAKEVSVPLRG